MGQGARLQAFAERVGQIEPATLHDLRITSHRWPPESRQAASWSCHRWLSYRPDRVEVLGKLCVEKGGRVTIDDLRTIVGDRRQALSLEGLERRLGKVVVDLLAAAQSDEDRLLVAKHLREQAEQIEATMEPQPVPISA